MNHAPNAIVSGLYYRLTRATPMGAMHTYLPLSAMEMPVDAGDVITKYDAPRGLDAALTLESFSEIVGPAYPHVTRVRVFDGILLNEQTANDYGTWRPVPSLKHALKLQAKFEQRRSYHVALRAAYDAERAEDIYIGKSYRDNAVSIPDALRMGLDAGWYVRTVGNDNWSVITVRPSADSTIIFGYRVDRRGNSYNRLTETFHPTLHELIVRKGRPTFGPVVDAEGYQPRGHDTKIPFANIR